MNQKVKITIGRQFGSGGREIGLLLSQKLHVAFLDSEIIAETAKKSGISEPLIESFDEKTSKSFLYALRLGLSRKMPENEEYDLPLPQQIFLAEYNTIQEIAREKSAVFVGRCADYVLKEDKETIRIFIYASLEDRITRIMERKNIGREEASDLIHRVDSVRAGYYHYYTSQKWGHPENYDVCINSSLCGIDKTADIMYSIICSYFPTA